MRKGIKELKRKAQRIFEEIAATKEIAKYTSISDAFATFVGKFDIQRMCRNGFQEPENVKRRLLKKHEVMMDYLEQKYKEYWRNYKTPVLSEDRSHYHNKIWVCWWQGLENAPEIVKICVDSIRRFAGDKEVIIVTEDNVTDFVDFPSHITEKVKAGIISRTIYSDLLRINLLSRHGGIWLDSTFFAISDLEKYVDSPIWSIKRPDYLHASIAGGNFSNYSLGCSYENRWVFKIVIDFLFYYWEHNDSLIDYLLTDYAIVMAQRHCKEMQDLISKIEPNNRYCDELWKVLDQPFDESLWNRIKTDTSLYKLSWKSEYPENLNGRITFYGKLMNGTLS